MIYYKSIKIKIKKIQYLNQKRIGEVLFMEKNEIEEYLKKYDYPSMVVPYYAEVAMNFAPELRSVFEKFLKTGEIQDFSFRNWTTKSVMEHTFSKPPFTYFYFDKMMKDEKYAESFQHMRFGRK